MTQSPSFWTMRRAHSTRAATYRCPFCGQLLHAMSEHLLIAPEGDAGRRRHAHVECVQRERAAGRFPLYDEVKSARRRGGVLWRLRSARRSS
jgi:hypothetical protein